MKKLFFLLLALYILLAAGMAEAVTISGTVRDAKTSQPVPGQSVTVTDSIGSFHVTANTNGSGLYTATLPTTPSFGTKIIASTTGCSAVVTAAQYFSGANMTNANLNVCTGSSVYALQGNVYLSGANSGQARLYLIAKAYDSLVMDTTYKVVDSFTSFSSGGSFAHTYATLHSGTLFLKAALLPTHPQYKKYLPTYYNSAITWSNAKALTTTDFIAADTIDIFMTPATDTAGTGSISGAVIQGAGKSTAVGDPLPGRIIILTRVNNVPVRYTYSDAVGKYYFDSLAYGTYKIFGDALGKSNPALTLTITTAKSSYPDILFTENSNLFIARIGGVGIAASSALGAVSLYPNPVSDRICFSGIGAIAGRKIVTLCDMKGAVVLRQIFDAGAVMEVPVNGLSSGVYLLTLQTEDGGRISFRVVK